jgi:nucleotide-binding universal stress UspA family protein
VTALQLQGATVATVLAEADRLGAELIVLGSHGHGAVYELLVGSVAEGVVRRSKVPVLLVPSLR